MNTVSEKVTIQERRIYMQNDRGSGLLVKTTGCKLLPQFKAPVRRKSHALTQNKNGYVPDGSPLSGDILENQEDLQLCPSCRRQL